MRIVIATAVYYPQINGVAVFSHNLACGLAARGHEVLVICPSNTGQSYVEMKDGVQVCYLHSVDVKVYPDQIHKVPERRVVGGVRLPRVFYRHGLRVSVFPAREVRRILDDFKPDVVHVFGTEYPHALSMARVYPHPERLLVGIQGVISWYAKQYLADLLLLGLAQCVNTALPYCRNPLSIETENQ